MVAQVIEMTAPVVAPAGATEFNLRIWFEGGANGDWVDDREFQSREHALAVYTATQEVALRAETNQSKLGSGIKRIALCMSGSDPYCHRHIDSRFNNQEGDDAEESVSSN